MKLSSFNYLVKQGISGMWKNKMLSFASFCIMLVSLLLVGLSFLTTLNIANMIDKVADKNEVVVVIADGISASAIEQIEGQIEDIDNISKVVFYSRNEAWGGLMEELTPEEQALFDYSDENPLPDTYRVTVSEISLLEETSEEISKIVGVEEVMAPSEFADILISMQDIVKIIAVVLILSLITVSLIVIFNTIRASVYARSREINIMKYVGANNTFIKVPFFIEGMFVGFLASVGAYWVTYLCYSAFFDLFVQNELITAVLGNEGVIPFDELMVFVAVGYVVAGIVIGAFGTVFSTRKYLKV